MSWTSRLAQAPINRVRIRTKILGIAVGSVVLLGTFLTFAIRHATYNTLRSDLRSQAASIAHQLAATDTEGILTNDVYGLNSSLVETMKADPDVAYAFLSNPRGNIIADTFPRGFPSSLVRLSKPSTSSRIVPIATEDGIVWDAAAPILGGSAGSAHVGLSEHRLQATVDRTTSEITLSTLLVAALACVGAFGLATVLSTPIERLERAAERVAHGMFDREVEVVSNDEIGSLGRAFNTMIRNLAESRNALIRQNRYLRLMNTLPTALTSATTPDATTHVALEWLTQAFGSCIAHISLTSDSDGPETAVSQNHHANGNTADWWLSVPIRSRGEKLGFIRVDSEHPARFTSDDIHLLEALGSQLGSAVDNALLWDEVKRRDELRGKLIDRIFEAQEEERRRVAREIHDHTDQVLSGLIVTVDIAQQALATQDHKLARVLAETRTECENLLERLDDLVLDLRPKLLDDLGLPAALEWLTQGFQTRSGVQVRLQVSGLRARIAPDVETAAFRIIQESLTNIVRHADANQASVDIRHLAGSLDIEVADDGCGFDPAAVDGMGTSHFGLLGMSERAGIVGGSFHLISSPGTGTRVQVSLPAQGADR